jgi:ferritin-like metal-binding protein YciE
MSSSATSNKRGSGLPAISRGGQVARLERVFAMIDQPAKGKTCDAINGIIDERTEVMREFKGSPALDAGLLASAQAVEHYEISRYGTLKAWAEKLGLNDAASLLDETPEEEKNTDEALTELAEAVVPGSFAGGGIDLPRSRYVI